MFCRTSGTLAMTICDAIFVSYVAGLWQALLAPKVRGQGRGLA